MGVYDELQKISTDSPTPSKEAKAREAREKIPSKQKPVNKPVRLLVDQSVNQPTSQSTSQSTDTLLDIDSIGPVVGRPCAFYITQRVDEWLDEAVRYLKEKGLHKVDRSVILNAILHDPELYNHTSLNGLRNRILLHLTNRSLKRVQSTE